MYYLSRILKEYATIQQIVAYSFKLLYVSAGVLSRALDRARSLQALLSCS